MVAVDPDMGAVEILDYVVVEDGGVLVNPLIVDGQVCGGTAQGIGTALFEEMPFDSSGQPLASTLADYILPGATEVPAIRIEHMETPSPYTEFGVKGLGEGGAIGPPAAIASAINDALRRLGAEVCASPMTRDASSRRSTRPKTRHEARSFRLCAAFDFGRCDRIFEARGPFGEASGRRPVARADAQSPPGTA